MSSHDNKRQLGSCERRIVGDEEKVYVVQHQWKSNAAKLVLTERDKALEVWKPAHVLHVPVYEQFKPVHKVIDSDHV